MLKILNLAAKAISVSIGVAIGLWIFLSVKLDKCAEEHKVPACEIIVVPKK
ncbi:hypothetical protein EVB55_146 [Rhizobium phage RHph_Y68]|uniref:Uncharacterized protein n=1 Tax=Rhizobium phage RHph_Y68 TaxID=2509787 RepID=A0A7S5QY73_9CAUD|nr:hypothetical protein PP934_gp146 [Rhizobium phage RHph_Y68]QIG68081.1 hypothetical protein EVB55_146 [Rhizobium phage RHph_Y68]